MESKNDNGKCSLVCQTSHVISGSPTSAVGIRTRTRGYSAKEAMQSYVRVANQHGWGVPRTWHGLFNH
ncbi:hypothetical protein SpCBS45565_g01866 [Spizellomyces sp. 'palustris']|nr:hypothetical protein SpCBS45565_g01866 [Spizellomyces sp. 'palustris']